MKLYDFERAPNPRRVRMFAAEKSIAIPAVNINLFALEQFAPAFRAINPACTVPVLETDDGTYLTETVAICSYLEELFPEPALMGKSAIEKALVLNWNNIVEQAGFFAVAETLRNWSPGFKNRVFPGPVSTGKNHHVDAIFPVIALQFNRRPLAMGEARRRPP